MSRGTDSIAAIAAINNILKAWADAKENDKDATIAMTHIATIAYGWDDYAEGLHLLLDTVVEMDGAPKSDMAQVQEKLAEAIRDKENWRNAAQKLFVDTVRLTKLLDAQRTEIQKHVKLNDALDQVNDFAEKDATNWEAYARVLSTRCSARSEQIFELMHENAEYKDKIERLETEIKTNSVVMVCGVDPAGRSATTMIEMRRLAERSDE